MLQSVLLLFYLMPAILLQVEDRPVIKEIKTYIREHHPVEKEFVVETRPTGQHTTFPCYCNCTHWHVF